MNDLNFFLLSSSTTSTTYHLRLYYNSHLNVIRSLVFYPSFLEKFFTPPIVWDISNPEEFRVRFESKFRKLEFFEIINHRIESHIHRKINFSIRYTWILTHGGKNFKIKKKLAQEIIFSIWGIGTVHHQLPLKEKIKMIIYFA